MTDRIEILERTNGDVEICVARNRRRATLQVLIICSAVLIVEALFLTPWILMFGLPSPTMLLAWGFATLTVVGIFLAVGLSSAGQRQVTFVAGPWGLEVRTTQSGDNVTKRFPRERIRAVGTAPGLSITTDEGTYPYLIEETQDNLVRIATRLNVALQKGVAPFDDRSIGQS